jgi:EAL domain-containing protein (putative c-di-GMP-specific phosphodiesterase class I)
VDFVSLVKIVILDRRIGDSGGIVSEIRKGNLVLLKRPMADLLCVVEAVSSVEPAKVILRYLHAPRDDSNDQIMVTPSDLIKLAEEQERELPGDLLVEVERQRAFVFKEKSRRMSVDPLGDGVKKADEDTLRKILDILAEG